MSIRVVPGYPQAVGAHGETLADVDGPASYNNTGTFGTSGQQINASDFGMGGFEYVEVDGMSSDGVNGIQVVPGAAIAGTVSLSPTPPGIQPPAPLFQSFVVHWYTTASNATEVANATNLAAKAIRMRLRGPISG